MTNLQKKKVEYKETQIFDWFPEIELTKIQKKRCLLFHTYGKSIQKMINYAVNFDTPNKLCLVFCISEPKGGKQKIEEWLKRADASKNICVIYTDFPKELIQFYDDTQTVIKQLITMNHWDKDKEYFNETFFEELRKYKKYLSTNPDDKDISNYYQEYFVSRFEIIRKYKKIEKHCSKYFTNFRLIRNGVLEKPFTYSKLDKLIQSTFPLSGESLGVNDYGLISIAGIDKCCEYAIDGIKFPKINFDLSLDNQFVWDIRRFINKQLEDFGYCNITDLKNFVTSAPYGAYYSGYYMACLIYALKDYDNRRMFYYDGCNVFGVKEHYKAIADVILGDVTRKIYNYNKRRLFIEQHELKTIKQFLNQCYGTTMEMPSFYMVTKTRRQMEKDFVFPISMIDEQLYRLTCEDEIWLNSSETSKMSKYIEENKEDLINKFNQYCKINSMYGDNYKKCVSQCAPWLWSKQIWEDVRKYYAIPAMI